MHRFCLLLLLLAELEVLAASVLVHLVVVVLREVDFDGAKLIDVGVDFLVLGGSRLEALSLLALLNGLGGGAVHVLHVKQVGVELNIQHEDSPAYEVVDVEAINEED